MRFLYKYLFFLLNSCASQITRGPQALLLLAAAALAAHWLGSAALILILPLGLLLFLPFPKWNHGVDPQPSRGRGRRRDMQTEIDRALIANRKTGTGLACVMITLQPPRSISPPDDTTISDHLAAISLDRLAAVLRAQDQLFDLGNGQIGIVISPLARPGFDALLRLMERLRTTLQAPVHLGSDTIRPSVAIGLCLDSEAPNRTARALCEAAMTALDAAGRHGASGLHIHRGQPQAMRAASRRITAEAATGASPGPDQSSA